VQGQRRQSAGIKGDVCSSTLNRPPEPQVSCHLAQRSRSSVGTLRRSYIHIYIYIYIYTITATRPARRGARWRFIYIYIYRLAFTRWCFTLRLSYKNQCLFCPPACIARTVAIVLHDYCAMYDAPPPNPLLYAIDHTILVMAISCKGQVGGLG